MKFLVAFAVALAVVAADVAHLDLAHKEIVPIIKSEYQNNADGSYSSVYETANGITFQAQGILKKTDSEYPASEVRGSYAYTAPNGEPIQVTYVANELGYQAQGAHLPVAPPVPVLIARSLEYNAQHPAKPENVATNVAGRF